MFIRKGQNHPVNIGDFAKQVVDVLVRDKYDRSGTGQIRGYGTKYFP